MSIIIAAGETISKSPLNNSPSKMMYSFPKTQRFFYQKRPVCDTLYVCPDNKPKRSTSFGYGNKYDFTKTKNTAPYYNLPTDFDPKKSYHPKYSFGISRSFYEKVILVNSGIL
jgi:hypothetical protein